MKKAAQAVGDQEEESEGWRKLSLVKVSAGPFLGVAGLHPRFSTSQTSAVPEPSDQTLLSFRPLN